jgi:hypothetical protein
MSVGFVYAKIRRGATPPHIGYGFQRRITPPGSESSSSPAASDMLLPAVDKGSSTKAAAFGCMGTALTRCCQRVKLERGIPSRRQNAIAERPLASHASKTFRHCAALRLTRPLTRARIDASSLMDGVRLPSRITAAEERRSLAAYVTTTDRIIAR